MSYNKIILVGNLTRDIELKYTQGGVAIANSAIATTKKFTSNGEKKEEVCFVDISFFNKIAEIANQYLGKGSKVLIEGSLKFEQWTDKNGQKRSKHTVKVDTMQMLGSKSDSQSSNAPQQQQQQVYQAPHGNVPVYNEQVPQQQQQSYAPPQQMPSSSSVPAIDIDEDKIPF